MSVLNKKGNKIMTTNFNFAKIRCRKLAWMRESVYKWWLVHTDHCSNTRPKNGPMGVMFEFIKTNLGNNLISQCPQGPPHG